MRACILNIELLLFYMFWPIKLIHFISDVIYGTPSVNALPSKCSLFIGVVRERDRVKFSIHMVG
jgi:hypothetical protein